MRSATDTKIKRNRFIFCALSSGQIAALVFLCAGCEIPSPLPSKTELFKFLKCNVSALRKHHRIVSRSIKRSPQQPREHVETKDRIPRRTWYQFHIDKANIVESNLDRRNLARRLNNTRTGSPGRVKTYVIAILPARRVCSDKSARRDSSRFRGEVQVRSRK